MIINIKNKILKQQISIILFLYYFLKNLILFYY
jgi:hypothetical protein